MLILFYPESGRSIVCAGHNATLQCGTGQIIEIDGAFYGRKTGHYCRSRLPPPATSTQGQCGWVDAVDSLAGKQHAQIVYVHRKHQLIIELTVLLW